MNRYALSALLLPLGVVLTGCGSVEPPPVVTEDIQAAHEQELLEVELQERLQQKESTAAFTRR